MGSRDRSRGKNMEVITQQQVSDYKPIPALGQMIEAEKLAIRSELYYKNLEDQGSLGHLPYNEVRGEFEFLPCEISLWSGEAKSKKSFFTGFQMLHLALNKQKCAIASFEMPPEVTFERMARAYTGKKMRTDGLDKMDLGERVQDYLYVYDFIGQAEVKDVYEYVHFCAGDLKCNHILIDSLMMIQFSSSHEIQNDQKNFITQLMALAKRYSVHIHLVTHFKKPDKSNKSANAYDTAGTAALINVPSNVFLIEKTITSEGVKGVGLTLSRSRSFVEWDEGLGLKFRDNFQFAHWKNTFSMSQEDMNKGCYF